MGDIAQRGNRLTKKHISKDLVRNVYEHVAPKHSPGQKGKPHSSKEGRTASIGRTVRDTMKILTGAERVKKFGGGRTNLLEELGRVEAEPSNRNRRAEISRVHGELNRGYKTGGRVGLKKGGKPWGDKPKPGTEEYWMQQLHKPRKGKAVGGVARLAKTAKKYAEEYHKKKKLAEDTKKGKFPETESLTHQVGPYVGDVGSEGKKAKKFAKRSHKKEEAAEAGTGYAIGGPAARAIKGAADRVLRPRGVFKKDKFKNPWEKPPQLRKSQKERREELRKKARKSGGHSKIVFHDEWKHIDPGLQKGLFKKDGGRAGLKKGGKSDKNWIQKAVNPKHKGYCTPMTKKTCTPARKALARTFKKKAKTGWG